jgi:LmbE family N-acetylglucosaminyl deacetylase
MEKTTGFEAFADVQRLIVVAAHPDDLETICGGVIALLAGRGVKIFSVNCTLGDIGTQNSATTRSALATARLQETQEAAAILGIEQTYCLDRHDGELVADLELRAQIARLYRITQADTLLTFDPFWPGQIHPDHRAAGQAAIDAYMPAKMPLYRPEHLRESGAALGALQRVFLFSTDREPDVFVDVSPVYAIKLAACLAHRSQFPNGLDSLQWLQSMDEARGQAIGAAQAESFKRMTVW